MYPGPFTGLAEYLFRRSLPAVNGGPKRFAKAP